MNLPENVNDLAGLHERFHGYGFNPSDYGAVTVHHRIASALTKAGHDLVCDVHWSTPLVVVDRRTVDLSKAMDHVPMPLMAALMEAQAAGLAMADIVTYLGAYGYEMRVVPEGAEVGEIVPLVSLAKVIREEGDQFCVYSEDLSRSFGCYPTREQAEARLAQVESFGESVEAAADVTEGMFVSWDSSGGRARGQVEHVMREGTLGVPGTEFSINAEPDDPAVLIRIWREFADGWRATETLVGHRASTLTVIEPLAKATKREDGEDFPPEAFAYVPDPESPSTWKLRLWDSLEERETRAQVGRAWQALSGAGFRGNRVQIPAEDRPAVIARVRAAYRRVWGEDAELPEVLKQDTFTPPQGVREAAQRAVEWIRDGRAGSGFTDVGRRRASQLANGDAVSVETLTRMRSYFARHEVDAAAEGFNSGEAGFPSPGRVAWDAWGGDAGRSWANMILDRLEKNGAEYYKPKKFLNPRQKMMYEKFEWIADLLGPWDPSAGPEGAHYISAADNVFKDEGLACSACVFYKGGGGCEILSEPVEADGLCKLWIIPEMPDGMETPDEVEMPDGDWDDYMVMNLAKSEARRFTLGPWYVPNRLDAHGEWTDSTELQAALWEYVRSGDRRIRLQHNTSVTAGEAVEMMTWPYPVELPMTRADGTQQVVSFPAETVFLGVVWEPWAWEFVKAGRITGYSIGGVTDRLLVDMPEE